MRTGLIVLLITGVSLAAPAWAACERGTIETISTDGDLIILGSGETYDVAPDDQSTAALWQEGDDVLVCRETMINKDENGEKIKVTPH
jgi:hypothetical protein